MIKISGTLFFCILFFTSCSQTRSKSAPDIKDKAFQQPSKIVLIFNLVNALEAKKFKEGSINFNYLPKISYNNDEFSEIFLNPLPKNINDF